MAKQILVVSFKDNPEIAEYFTDKKVGDPCHLEIEGTLMSNDADKATVETDAIVPEGYEVAKPDGDEVDQVPMGPVGGVGISAGQPMPNATAMMVKKMGTK